MTPTHPDPPIHARNVHEVAERVAGGAPFVLKSLAKGRTSWEFGGFRPGVVIHGCGLDPLVSFASRFGSREPGFSGWFADPVLDS